MKRTGPTLILKRCPICNELVRTDQDGRFELHTNKQKFNMACAGSGEIPDPLR